MHRRSQSGREENYVAGQKTYVFQSFHWIARMLLILSVSVPNGSTRNKFRKLL